MKITTKAQYDALTDALISKGYTPETVYPVLKNAGFTVKLKGEVLEGIYASRVIALMHAKSDQTPLEL